ncbi:MAG: OmpA family protein [Prevotella sp.]|nr:OmpA family protein [Prevotella sp.]
MKHFMNFKRGAAVLSAIAMAVSVSAQTENYVPKHEFSISGFGGLSTLNYKVNIPQNPFIDGVDRKMGLGGGVGLDWTYHFSKHWGLRLGVQAALYNAKAKKDFTLNGIYMRDQALIDIDGKLQEKQRAVYAQVPLMVQWMTPAGKNHFYVALGGKLGMRLWDNYKQIVDAKPTYHPVYNAPTRAAYDPEGKHESYRGTIGLKRFDVMGSAEVGMRWTLGNGVGLYTGIYFDYGFLNTAPNGLKVDDERNDGMSILAAEVPMTQRMPVPGNIDYVEDPTFLIETATVQQPTYNRLVDKVHKMAGGLVLRLSFGKGKAVVAPCPECPIVEPIEKIKEVYHHDTIRIVKEIPQEIKDKMKDLSNALFAFDKFDISPKAQTILNDVATWLKKNPQMKCELSGHTDGKGSVAYNQKLSEQRAQAVYDYLVKAGVSSDNLTWKGYGKSEPIATNDTAEGRQLNRRVELRLIR